MNMGHHALACEFAQSHKRVDVSRSRELHEKLLVACFGEQFARGEVR